MRAISLTKTEKKFVILLVVVAVVNFIGLLLLGFNLLTYDFELFMMSIIFWVSSLIIIEILVVVVLILMIRKE